MAGTNTVASSSTAQASNPTQPSRRWTHFHSALQLAIQRAAHKWTYDEFAECFELWCKEEPDGAAGVYNTISSHMESLISNACEKLLVRYNARENIDILHAVVMEAKELQQAGRLPGPDTWRANLEPRSAVRARTVPVLRKERDRLLEQVAEMEQSNLELQKELVATVAAMKQNDAEEKRRLDFLDELEAKWTALPLEDIQEWTLQTAEALAKTA